MYNKENRFYASHYAFRFNESKHTYAQPALKNQLPIKRSFLSKKKKVTENNLSMFTFGRNNSTNFLISEH